MAKIKFKFLQGDTIMFFGRFVTEVGIKSFVYGAVELNSGKRYKIFIPKFPYGTYWPEEYELRTTRMVLIEKTIEWQ